MWLPMTAAESLDLGMKADCTLSHRRQKPDVNGYYWTFHPMWKGYNSRRRSSSTWAVGHCVKVTVGEHEMVCATLRLQPDSDVGDTVIEAGEAAKKVNGERAGGTLHIHRELMGARCCFNPDFLNLLQQVAHCQDFILRAANRPRADAGDLLQVLSTWWGEGKSGETQSEMWGGAVNQALFFCLYSISYLFPTVHTLSSCTCICERNFSSIIQIYFAGEWMLECNNCLCWSETRFRYVSADCGVYGFILNVRLFQQHLISVT